MSENSRLRIHTSVRPPEEAAHTGQPPAEEVKEVLRTPPEMAQNRSGRPTRQRRTRVKQRREEEVEQLTTGEKLLRNTAVACALLLTVMALKNVDQPWSRKAAEGIRQAMTMRVDWDETLGRLSFVRSIVPDTALVFLNMGQGKDLLAPVRSSVSHEYTAEQPWLEYRCAASEAVCAAAAGTVTAAGQGAGEDWVVVVESEDGAETVYGYLASVCVKAGEAVEEGQQIGLTANEHDSRLYFELREGGESTDPTARLK